MRGHLLPVKWRRHSITLAMLGFACLSAAPPAVAADSQGEANIALVKRYVSDIRDAAFVKHDKDLVRKVAEKYMTPDYDQHKDGVGPDREGYIGGLWAMAQAMPRDAKLTLNDIYFMADHDRVTWLTRRAIPDQNASGNVRYLYILNMVRIENGKLKEHWGG